MKKRGELVELPERHQDFDWVVELDRLLMHDEDHRWYWNFGCCGLKNKLKRFIQSFFLSLANERIASIQRRIITVMEKPTGERTNKSAAGNVFYTDHFADGNNSALSEEINYWENFIEELNQTI